MNTNSSGGGLPAPLPRPQSILLIIVVVAILATLAIINGKRHDTPQETATGALITSPPEKTAPLVLMPQSNPPAVWTTPTAIPTNVPTETYLKPAAGNELGDRTVLGFGDTMVTLTFPSGTRWTSLVIPANATTNSPTVWVVMPDGADRYNPQVKTDIFAQTLFSDGSVGEWMKTSPAAPLPYTFSPIRAMRFALANPNTPVPLTIRFRGLQ